ncbi:hypothetical protein [Roseibium sp.]|uniref:hypothetical protein n=1 Tax=Roseibium sp. TaxID=1936156 RepID=UPI003B526DAE
MASSGGETGIKQLCVRGAGMAACLGLLLQNFTPGAFAQEFSPNVSSLGSLTCQQLWYLEHEVLAEGRICLKSARARHAFKRAKPCISSEERILPENVRNYLTEVRKAARAKTCSKQ